MNWKDNRCEIASMVSISTLVLTGGAALFTGLGTFIGAGIGNMKDVSYFNDKGIDTHDKYAHEGAGFGTLAGAGVFVVGLGLLCCAFIIGKRLSSEESTPLLGSNSNSYFSRLSNRVRACFVREEKEVIPFQTTGL